jgi:proteasome beta subunit
MGGICHFLFGGFDTTGVSLYEIYPDGSIMNIKDDTGFTASGSGSVMAYGVLEDTWKKGLTEEQGVDLALRSVNAAIQRDAMSGQGVDVFVIDKKGVRKVAQKILNTRVI